MRIMVGMSGGVDSSVAAWLLKAAGHEVCGVTLLLASSTKGPTDRSCCSPEEVASARAVASIIGINHLVFDFSELFEREVETRFSETYAAGRTPNPCIECNRRVKFPALLKRARELGYDGIATGHYARLSPDARTGRMTMRRAADPTKDQSYVLYALSQDVLKHTVLPLGALTKDEVRRIAAEAGLPNAQKPDSEDICFVPDGDYASFLAERGIVSEPGDIVDDSGTVIGHHRGLIHYTVGQRKGVQVTTLLPHQEPYYVIDKLPDSNRLVAGPASSLAAETCEVDDLNWVSLDAPEQGSSIAVQAKIRYRQTPVAATATIGPSCTSATVTFDGPTGGIAPGQACVFYDGDLLLGGGTITHAVRRDTCAVVREDVSGEGKPCTR